MFLKSCLLQRLQKASIWGKGLTNPLYNSQDNLYYHQYFYPRSGWLNLTKCCVWHMFGSSIILWFTPFSHKGHFLMPLRQTTFENIVIKREIAHGEQLILLLICFQPDFIIILSLIEIFQIFAKICFHSCLLQICCMWERDEKSEKNRWVHTYYVIYLELNLSLIRQFCSRRLWTYFVK